MTQMNLSTKQKENHGHREKTGGGMNWEIGIDMYPLICIK